MTNVYILIQDGFIQGVYATKQAAFRAIKADSAVQTLRTEDGDEEFIPTADSVMLDEDIYARYNECTNDLIGFTAPAENRIYQIKEYKVID